MRELPTCCAKAPLMLVLGMSLSLLGACAGSKQSTEPPQLDAAPEALTKPCERPVTLPDRALTQAEVERLWITDRARLVECGMSKQAVVDYYANRDGRIGAPQSSTSAQ